MSSGLFGAIKTSASGLRGQRLKMDVVARNLANAETTRTEDGTPYRRQRAIFEQVLGDKVQAQKLRLSTRAGGDGLLRTRPGHMSGLMPDTDVPEQGIASDVHVAEDAGEFRVIYDPGHPDADAEGYVLLPNVNPITEMVDMINASRAYEANVSAVQTAKEMFSQALKI
ncbi:flagellar basal body rod protein FlgC [bacterium DOLJORAL78_65_58]|nr:MAG: flagellar basal body rod protein FlgC [bacterium DOLZORAL124_64_63]PIE76239.1 MAG: flagellar basal body rod protein FlgC [bacterium DOLJORAL78_65_58]